MRPQHCLRVALVACLVLASFTMAAPAAFGQGRPGGGGGGGHTEVAVNNLSYPALMVGATGSPAVSLSADVHEFGATYSYGCDKPEMVGTYSYPNTSCLAADGVTLLTKEQCTAEGAKCAGLTVDRIYWQKVSTSYWKAATTGPATGPVAVDYLDWGDNLEAKNWTATSIIRVETTPFEDHLASDPAAELKRGYQMWHVSGQGITEQWGIRVQEDPVTGEPVAAYGYDSQFAIVNTGAAKLHIAKLSPTAAPCPSAYTDTPFAGSWVDGNWTGACTLKDIGYTPELNVGGKYVYGYNWAVRRDPLPVCNGTTWDMAGWWRLTFHTPGGELTFPNPNIPTAPPLLPTPGVLMAAAEEEGDTGALYRPVINAVNHITYIDICVTAGSGGGGKIK